MGGVGVGAWGRRGGMGWGSGDGAWGWMETKQRGVSIVCFVRCSTVVTSSDAVNGSYQRQRVLRAATESEETAHCFVAMPPSALNLPS